MRTVPIAQLPEELASRVRAAAGQAGAGYLLIHQRADESDATGAQYLVEAITGDRITVMHLSSRPDASVAETTDSLVVSDVLEVMVDEGRAELTVMTPDGRRSVPVTPEMAEAVEHARGSRGSRDIADPPRPRPRHGLS